MLTRLRRGGFSRIGSLAGCSAIAMLTAGAGASPALAQATPGSAPCPVVADIVTCTGALPDGVDVTTGSYDGLMISGVTGDMASTDRSVVRYRAQRPTTQIRANDTDSVIRLTTTEQGGAVSRMGAIDVLALDQTTFSLESDLDIVIVEQNNLTGSFNSRYRPSGLLVRGSRGNFSITNAGDISISGVDRGGSSHGAIYADIFGADLITVQNSGALRETPSESGSNLGRRHGILIAADNRVIEITNSGNIDVVSGVGQQAAGTFGSSGIGIGYQLGGLTTTGVLVFTETDFVRPSRPQTALERYRIVSSGTILSNASGIVVDTSYASTQVPPGTPFADVQFGSPSGEIVNSGTIRVEGAGIAVSHIGSATLINNGLIEATEVSATGASQSGIIFDGFSTAGQGPVLIENGATGIIRITGQTVNGNEGGLVLRGRPGTIRNSGLIAVAGNAAMGIRLDTSGQGIGQSFIESSGRIEVNGDNGRAIYLELSALNNTPISAETRITSSGLIEALGAGSSAIYADLSGLGTSGPDNVGAVTIDLSATAVLRGGTSTGTAITLINGRAHTITNAGLITAGSGVAIIGGAAAETIDNRGRIEGSIALAGGDDAVLIGAGSVFTGAIDMGEGADLVETVIPYAGAIALGAGDDRLRTLTGGLFSGAPDGGDGTDALGIDIDSGNTVFADRFTGAFTNFELIEKTGAGTLTLTAPVLPRTSLLGGTLVTNGDLGAMAVDGSAGTTLDVTGRLGAATLADGALMTPGGGAVATVDLASLNLSATSRLRFDLGAPDIGGGIDSDLVNIAGNLVLDGVLDINASPAFGDGVYRLFNYGGTLTDNGMRVGSAPNASYTVQTLFAGQVNLIVGPIQMQFWDGSNTSADGAIAGGSGTWDPTTTNWTRADGGINEQWFGGIAVFQGAPGTVTIDAAGVSTTGLQFAVGGYRIEGGPLTVSAPAMVRVGDGSAAGANMTATITSVITGAGGIDKSDLGTLILSAANTYTGATTVSAGTLDLSGSVAGALQVGRAGRLALGGTTRDLTVSGTLLIDGGRDAVSDVVALAPAVGDDVTATATGAGTTWATGDLAVGVNGEAELTVSGGAIVTSARGAVGNVNPPHPNFPNNTPESTGVGTVAVTGANSRWDVSGQLMVALNSTGTLNVSAGGTIASAGSNLGRGGSQMFDGDPNTFTASIGGATVTGAGSAWTDSAGIIIGNAGGRGTLTIADGGRVSTPLMIIGTGGQGGGAGNPFFRSEGLVTVSGASSTLEVTGELSVGSFNGNGQLIVADGGRVSAGEIIVANRNPNAGIDGSSSGLLAIGAGLDANGAPLAAAAPGVVDTPRVTFRELVGEAILVFNHNAGAAANYVFAPAMSGEGEIRHVAGVTRLTGDGAGFTGPTNVSGGTLLVTGALGGTITVAAGGTLGGTGSLGNLSVAGTLSPGLSTGTLTVNGNLTFAAGSTYLVELLAAGGADQVNATGTLTINGGTVAIGILDPELTYTDGAVARIINAAGGRTGTFASLTENSAFLDFILGYDATGVTVTVDVLRTFPDVAFTFNQRQASTALAQFNAGGADALAVYNQLLLLDADPARAAFDLASGEIYAVTLAAALRQGDSLASRLLARSNETMGANWGLWAGVSGLDGRVEDDGNGGRFRHDGFGGELGIDYRGPGNGWAVGIGGGYTNLDAELPARRSDADGDGWHLGGYVRYGTGGDGFTITGSAVYASISASATRNIAFGTLARTARARIEVNGFTLAAEARYGFEASTTWSLGPLLRLSHSSLTLDSLAETGADSLNLAGGDNDDDRTRFGIGAFARFEGAGNLFDLAAGYMTGGAAPTEIGLAMAGAPGTAYRIRSARGDGDSAFGQIGATFALGGGWSIDARVRGSIGSNERTIAGNITIGWQF